MNPEWLMIACMSLGGTLFAVGGTGWKPARRFVLPVSLALLGLFHGFEPLSCLGYAVTMIVALCLPYGSGTPYWQKAFTFSLYPLPSVFFGLTWWQPITALVCFGCFVLSNWKPTEKTFLWKICEFIIGACLGITVAALIAQTY